MGKKVREKDKNVRQIKEGKIRERVLGFGIFNPGEGQIKNLSRRLKRKANEGNISNSF